MDAAVVVQVQVPLHLRQVQHGDGPAVLPSRRADPVGEGGQKFPLKAVPGV